MSTGQPSATSVTSQQREQFERDGYFILDSVGVPTETLDAIIEDVAGFYGKPRWTEDKIFYGWRRVQEAWKLSPNVKALALAPNVLPLLEDLYGRKPIPFQTLNFWTGTQQAPHSDTLHFNSKPAGYMCGVWIALEDIDMDNGPLVYYPGSHKLPEVTMRDVGVRADYSEYKQYERHIAELIEQEELEPAYATITKGQALVWASNLLHGGAKQKDPDRTRHSQVTHYFFEGCRYWTPMRSEGEEVSWRDVEQIA
jgi:ectoine hydroxylase-related dioxygenase (phytanoyl-CoA dioxygenase family)